MYIDTRFLVNKCVFDATVHLQLDAYVDPICTFGIDVNEAWLCGTSMSRMLVAAANINLIRKGDDGRSTTALLLAVPH